MYGPMNKNGPALEFGEIGEEVKEEVRRQVIGKIVERARGKLKARDEREDDPFWGRGNQEHLRRAAKRLDSGEGVEHGLIEEERCSARISSVVGSPCAGQSPPSDGR